MSDLQHRLAQMGPDIESQLRPQLSGFFGGLIRGYLPQAWVFKTEKATATLVVNRSGSVVVVDGAVQAADVAITWGHEQLMAALLTRSRSKIPPGPSPHTSFLTPKGRTAFNFLRNRLGL